MNIFCINTRCKNFNISTEIEWDGKTSSLESTLICPHCGSKREILKSVNKPSLLNVNISPFSTMSVQERKQKLKERSNKHYQENIKDKKEYLDRHFNKTGKQAKL